MRSNSISRHLVQFGSHESCRNKDMFFIGHLAIVQCDGGDPFSKAITLSSLLAIALGKGEVIFFSFVT